MKKDAVMKAFEAGLQYIYDTCANDMPWSPDEIEHIKQAIRRGEDQ